MLTYNSMVSEPVYGNAGGCFGDERPVEDVAVGLAASSVDGQILHWNRDI